MRIESALPGGRTSALLLEQRIHYVADCGKFQSDSAHYVSFAVQKFKDTLEQNHSRSDIQCAEAVHGDEQQAVRRVQFELQAGETTVRALTYDCRKDEIIKFSFFFAGNETKCRNAKKYGSNSSRSRKTIQSGQRLLVRFGCYIRIIKRIF